MLFRSVSAVDRSALPEKLRHNLPEWLADILKPALGDEFWPLVESMSAAAPLDLRVNTFKAKRAVLAKEVRDHAVGGVLQLQHAVQQFGGEFEQGVRVHRRIILGYRARRAAARARPQGSARR